MAKGIVFDVNGTLPGLSTPDPHIERIFGNAYLRKEWFHTLERICIVDVNQILHINSPAI
jgi:hypothetical protein